MRALAAKVAFITGGASGIGLGMAQAFLEAGMKVLIADIRNDHLADARALLSGQDVHLTKLDVTNREGWIEAADEAEEAFGRIDVLCNNAGVGIIGPIARATWDDWDWLLDVNLGGVINGVATILPRIRAHGEGGHVVATSSIGGLVVADSGGIYSTSKFAVVALMECLREDLAAEGIGISVLCPTVVNTSIHDHAGMRPQRYGETGYRLTPEDETQAIGALKTMLSTGSDPLDVGRLVLRAIQRNEPYVLTDARSKAFVEARLDALLASLPNDEPDFRRLEVDMELRRMLSESLALTAAAARDATRSGVR